MSLFAARTHRLILIFLVVLSGWHLLVREEPVTITDRSPPHYSVVDNHPGITATADTVKPLDKTETLSQQKAATVALPEDNNIRIPIETEELVSWRLERGYPDEINSYDTYDEATLNALAATGDLRAMHKLAERIASRTHVTDADWAAIAELHRTAALYGSTFAFLSLGVQQESAYTRLPADDPRRHDMALEILATYQVAELRGDRMPNLVRGNHFVTTNNIQLTDEDRQLIAARAQEIYNNLSKHRYALALDEFDNDVPESVHHYFGEVEAIQQKLKARAQP